jgi:Zn-dependent protease with chaperone function
MARGVIYDGLSARPRPVTIVVEPDALAISFDDGGADRVPLGILTRGATHPERLTVHRGDLPDWRLVVTEPELAAMLRRLRPVGRFSRRTMAAYAAVSLLVIAGTIGLWLGGERMLDLATPLVPHRWQESLGQLVIEEIGGDRCTSPKGQAALDHLLNRLRPVEGFAEHVRVIVADNGTINAFAAPGGQVVILRGLIDQAESPDEVAGVLAHEITHVQLRHPTKALIRALGLSTLIQSLGGQTGAIANEAILLHGSRSAERAADAGALKLLARANISPVGMADFFRRMAVKATAKPANKGGALIDRLGSFMATHPGNKERVEAIEAAGRGQTGTMPALSDEDWKSLRAICASTGR